MYSPWPLGPPSSFMELGFGEQLLHNIQISPTQKTLPWITWRLLCRCRILGKYKVQVLSKKWSWKFRVEQSVQTTSRRWWGAGIQPSFFSSHCIWVRKHSDFMKMMGAFVFCHCSKIYTWFNVGNVLQWDVQIQVFVGSLKMKKITSFFKSKLI